MFTAQSLPGKASREGPAPPQEGTLCAQQDVPNLTFSESAVEPQGDPQKGCVNPPFTEGVGTEVY